MDISFNRKKLSECVCLTRSEQCCCVVDNITWIPSETNRSIIAQRFSQLIQCFGHNANCCTITESTVRNEGVFFYLWRKGIDDRKLSECPQCPVSHLSDCMNYWPCQQHECNGIRGHNSCCTGTIVHNMPCNAVNQLAMVLVDDICTIQWRCWRLLA